MDDFVLLETLEQRSVNSGSIDAGYGIALIVSLSVQEHNHEEEIGQNSFMQIEAFPRRLLERL